jgi:hypothetical protein
MRLQRLGEALARRALLQHDEGLGLQQAVLVLSGHHRRLQHSGMGGERRLHFERRNPDAADLEHVVRAPAIGVAGVSIASIFVAGARPLALECRTALDPLVPIAVARRGTAHIEFADLAVRNRLHPVVEQPQFIAGHRLARRAIDDVAGRIGEEDMQHFGRADAIENIDAETRAPRLADMFRQRLASRCADAQARRAAPLGRCAIVEHSGEEGRHAAKDRRRRLLQRVEDGGGRRPRGQQIGGGADMQGKRQGIAEAIGEEQFGGGIDDIVLANLQHLASESQRRLAHARMNMAHAFRAAGGA